MQIYFDQLQEVFDLSNPVDKKDYKDYLTQANSAGFTPLLSSLVEGNPDNVQLYFNQLEKVFNLSNPTDKKEYKAYFIQANKVGFTPLLEALVSGNLENVRLYFNQLEKVFNLYLILQIKKITKLI